MVYVVTMRIDFGEDLLPIRGAFDDWMLEQCGKTNCRPPRILTGDGFEWEAQYEFESAEDAMLFVMTFG